jgi:hypothetical protein
MNCPFAMTSRSLRARFTTDGWYRKASSSQICGMTMRSQNVTHSCRGTMVTRSARSAVSAPTDLASSSGACRVSASVNRSSSPPAAR